MKGVFVMNQDEFHCPRCRNRGIIEKERYQYENNFPVIKEVRVEYNYDAFCQEYREIAIARDDELGVQCNILTVFSPLCKTEKRALKLATLYFAYVSLHGVGVKNLNSREQVLDLDAPLDEFKKQLISIGQKWDESAIMRKKGMPYASE